MKMKLHMNNRSLRTEIHIYISDATSLSSLFNNDPSKDTDGQKVLYTTNLITWNLILGGLFSHEDSSK